MHNILINLFSKSLSEEKFQEYSSNIFSGYEIYNYHFPVEEMFPEIIEAIVNQILVEQGLKLNKTKIVFQTNVVDLGHFIAKAYSELVDGVIITGEKIEVLTEAVSECVYLNKIIKQKYSKYRIQNVFVHESVEYNAQYLLFLFKNQLFDNIAPFNNFKLVVTSKLNHNFCYILPLGEYSTSVECMNDELVRISCDSADTPYDISDISNLYGALKILNLLLEYDFIDIEQKRNTIDIISNGIKNKNMEHDFMEIVKNYVESITLNLDTYINYTYLCILLGDQEGVKRIYKYMNENINTLNLVNVHAFITNSAMYISNFNQIIDAEAVQNRLDIMSKLKQYWSKKIKLPKNKLREDNHIAIVAGQLLSLSHSPTKWVINYANALKEYNSKLKIKIFVEDWFNYSPNELSWALRFQSNASKELLHVHKKELLNDIEVYYSDSNLDRESRLVKDIKAITDFKPSVIYKIGSKYNIATDILYDHYPIISHTMGGAEDSDFVDVFTGGYYKEVMENMYNDLNISKQTYINHKIWIEIPESKMEFKRATLNLLETDFVLITVGNRLEAEITPEFVEQMIETLEKDSEIKWFIIGIKDLPIISDFYKEFIERKQIIFVEYENNLFDFYRICDVYVNPERLTGGISGAWAMMSKLPVITTNVDSDVGGMVGIKNCIDIKSFSHEILLLKNDSNYYNIKAEEMLNQIKKLSSIENTMTDLEDIFQVAINKFEMRINK